MNEALPKVNFTRMADGTAADYALLHQHETNYIRDLPTRLVVALRELGSSFGGYQVSRLQHSLQAATRAEVAGEDDEMVAAALLHDVGDGLAPLAHSELAAAILRPYVSDKVYWIVKHHGVFQMYYYAHHLGGDRNAREKYRDHKWYQDCVNFCEHYDQNCFDPNYESKPLEYFIPLLKRIFAEPRAEFLAQANA